MMTSAGTVVPSPVLELCGWLKQLQQKIGAVVSFDVRVSKEQVESLGAKFIE